MPVIKSAIKKLRQDTKKSAVNDEWREKVHASVRVAKKKATSKTLQEAYSVIDKAVKHNILHKNRAARMKSQLSKLIKTSTPVKKTPTKTAAKPRASKRAQAVS